MGESSAWVSWAEASRIVGCPVPTIESAARRGEFVTRPRHGRRPTVLRSSIEEFALRWQQAAVAREQARARRLAQRPRELPQGDGWVSSSQAARILDLTPIQVTRLARQGDLGFARLSGRNWYRRTDVEALAGERSEWVSLVQAAQIAGCSTHTIALYTAQGVIARREAARSLPSLRRSSVEAFAGEWAQVVDQREQERRERARQAQLRGAPDTGEVWLTAAQVAVMFQVTAKRVHQLASQDRLPHTVAGRRRWFPRRQIEQITAARILRRRFDARAAP